MGIQARIIPTRMQATPTTVVPTIMGTDWGSLITTTTTTTIVMDIMVAIMARIGVIITVVGTTTIIMAHTRLHMLGAAKVGRGEDLVVIMATTITLAIMVGLRTGRTDQIGNRLAGVRQTLDQGGGQVLRTLVREVRLRKA